MFFQIVITLLTFLLPGNGPVAPRTDAAIVRHRFLRTDVQATVGTMVVQPAMGLWSEVSAESNGGAPIWRIEACLLPQEVGPAIDALLRRKYRIVALGSRIPDCRPAMRWLTAQTTDPGDGTRTPEMVYASLVGVIGKIPAPPASPPTGKVATVPWSRLDEFFGVHGSVEQQVVHRYEWAGDRASEWCAFYACPCGKTMMRGSLDYRDSELQEGLRRLRSGRVDVDAIDSRPDGARVSFSAEGDAVELASAIQTARRQ